MNERVVKQRDLGTQRVGSERPAQKVRVPRHAETRTCRGVMTAGLCKTLLSRLSEQEGVIGLGLIVSARISVAAFENRSFGESITNELCTSI